jgi:muconolactone D-isomerase
MEFLVAFEVHVPDGAPASEVEIRQSAEASAAARLVDGGHLVRLWKPPAAPDETKALGLCTAPTAQRSSPVCSALCRSTTGWMSRSPRSSPIPTILCPRRPSAQPLGPGNDQ